MSDEKLDKVIEKLHEIDVKVAESNANFHNLASTLAEDRVKASQIEKKVDSHELGMAAKLAPIQKHVTQVQTGIRIIVWVFGSGVLGGLITFFVKR